MLDHSSTGELQRIVDQLEKDGEDILRSINKINKKCKDFYSVLSRLASLSSEKTSPSSKKLGNKKSSGKSAVENDGDDEKQRPSTSEELSNETDSSHAEVCDITPRSKKGRRTRRQRRGKPLDEPRGPGLPIGHRCDTCLQSRGKPLGSSGGPAPASGLSDETLTPTWTGPEISVFSELPLSAALLQGLMASPAGDSKLTKFQRTALPALLTDRDVVVQAVGTTDDGKTAAIATAALHKVKPAMKTCQVLLLTSSRESAKQLYREVLALATFIRPRLTCHLSIGGTSIRDDLRDMCTGCHVVVGTLGRAFDMLRRGALRAAELKLVLLDNIDTMMTRRFDKDHIYAVLGDVTAEAEGLQVVMIHSMMHADIPKATTLFTRSPVTKVLIQGEPAEESTALKESESQMDDAIQKLTEKLGQVSLPEILVEECPLPQTMAECVVEEC